MKLHATDVKMVYHPYPSSDPGLRVAEGLEAAGEQGKFWEVQDQLLNISFAEMAQSDVDAYLTAAAKNAGLDMSKFQQALDSPEVEGIVQTAHQQAVSSGVNHPSIYVDGKEVVFETGSAADLQSAVDNELKRLGR